MTIDAYQPFSTAPRDGTPIELLALDSKGQVEARVIMCWDVNATNGMFPGVAGFWVTPDWPGPQSFTWNDRDPDGAPTHWRPVRKN